MRFVSDFCGYRLEDRQSWRSWRQFQDDDSSDRMVVLDYWLQVSAIATYDLLRCMCCGKPQGKELQRYGDPDGSTEPPLSKEGEMATWKDRHCAVRGPAELASRRIHDLLWAFRPSCWKGDSLEQCCSTPQPPTPATTLRLFATQ